MSWSVSYVPKISISPSAKWWDPCLQGAGRRGQSRTEGTWEEDQGQRSGRRRQVPPPPTLSSPQELRSSWGRLLWGACLSPGRALAPSESLLLLLPGPQPLGLTEAGTPSLAQPHAHLTTTRESGFSREDLIWDLSFFVFLGPHPRRMEVPRLGVESELQLLAYTTATAMPDPSRVCELHHSSWQYQIPDPLSKARDQTHSLMDTRQVHYH